MAKKPKAWRAFIDGPGEMARGREAWAMRCLCHKGEYNCTVIPDGATVPLPASVRRVMRAAIAWQHSGHVTGLCMAATTKLSQAVETYERATKAKGRRCGT